MTQSKQQWIRLNRNDYIGHLSLNFSDVLCFVNDSNFSRICMFHHRWILSHRHHHRLVERMNYIVLLLERVLLAKLDHWLFLRLEVVCLLYYGLEREKWLLNEVFFFSRLITSPKVENIVFVRCDLIRCIRCHIEKMFATFFTKKKMSNKFSNRLNHICWLNIRWY